MSLIVVTLCLIGVQLLLYVGRYRKQDEQVWSAPAAWLRAGMYFCSCLLVAELTGAVDTIIESPLVWQGQLQDPWWWLSTVVVLIFIIAAYWGYWYHLTLQFERRLHPVSQLVFGLCWGVTSGLLLLAFWQIANAIGKGWPPWLVWLLAYGLISVWQALFMDMVWNVYIAPEHDSAITIQRKLARTHIPNMTLCLLYLAVYRNYGIFVALQTLALVAASFGMRMPPPWSDSPGPASRRVPGLFGLPRGGGYIEQ
jgi:hypothetical protein